VRARRSSVVDRAGPWTWSATRYAPSMALIKAGGGGGGRNKKKEKKKVNPMLWSIREQIFSLDRRPTPAYIYIYIGVVDPRVVDKDSRNSRESSDANPAPRPQDRRAKLAEQIRITRASRIQFAILAHARARASIYFVIDTFVAAAMRDKTRAESKRVSRVITITPRHYDART